VTETQIAVMVWAGIAGLSCWFVGIADHLYRLGMPRNRRSAGYDRVDNLFIAAGSVGVVTFVAGLYRLAFLVVR